VQHDFYPGDVIKEVFIIVKDNGNETIHVLYTTGKTETTGKPETVYQRTCKLTVIPDLKDNEKVDIVSHFKGYSSVMAQEAEQVMAAVQRMKAHFKELEQNVLRVRPGIVLDRDFKYDLLQDAAPGLSFMVDGADLILEHAAALASGEVFPVNKKRKFSD
jgi:hypothetical protein